MNVQGMGFGQQPPANQQAMMGAAQGAFDAQKQAMGGPQPGMQSMQAAPAMGGMQSQAAMGQAQPMQAAVMPPAGPAPQMSAMDQQKMGSAMGAAGPRPGGMAAPGTMPPGMGAGPPQMAGRLGAQPGKLALPKPQAKPSPLKQQATVRGLRGQPMPMQPMTFDSSGA